MTKDKQFEAADEFARALFRAKHGHSGMTWEQLDDEFGKGGYRKTVGRMFESFWDPDQPYLVIDLDNDVLWITAEEPS